MLQTAPHFIPALDPPRARAWRYRGWLLLLLFGASLLNYFDRQAVGVLKTTLQAEFAIDDAGYALLVNAFTACYALAYVGSGWMVDRIGPRALTLFLGVWSAATLACGVVSSLSGLVLLRALLGIAEPGNQPVAIRVGTEWAPAHRRGLFMSLCGLGSSAGAVLAAPVIAGLSLTVGWRWAFILPGLAGLVLAGAWLATYRDARASGVRLVAVDATPPRPWPALWRERALWAVVLCRLITDPVWYYCLFWLPGYLQEQRGATLAEVGMTAWIPFVAANVGGLVMSAWSDRVARGAVSPLRARTRLLAGVSVLGLLAAAIPHAPGLAGTIALFCVIAVVCNAWLFTLAPIIAEIFSVENVGSVWAIAGAFGAVGAIAFNTFIGHAAHAFGPGALFLAMSLLHPVAAILLVRYVRPRRAQP